MATVSYTKIYSNDGSTVLFTSSQSYATGGGASATVTETGVTFPSETYTYSGNKKFLGISSSANATTPTYAIGDTFTLGTESGSLYIVEEESKEYTLRIDGVEVTDYENVIVNGVSYKVKSISLITFTIDGDSYQAKEGMNWYEWCNSSYNTYGYVCSSLNSQVTTSSYMRYIENVRGSDVIVSGQGYIGKYPESND